MPVLPILRDATIPLLDTLIPRDPKASAPIARQPVIASSVDGTIALSAPNDAPIARRAVLPGIIPTYYQTNGPAAGLVVGIVLGSVLGFIFLAWLFWQLTSGNAWTAGTTIAGEEEVVVRRRRNSHGGRSRRSAHVEKRYHSRSPRRSGGGRSQVIVEERRTSRPRSILVEERRHRVPGDDMVEVVEEHSDSYESVSRRDSRSGRGYRY